MYFISIIEPEGGFLLEETIFKIMPFRLNSSVCALIVWFVFGRNTIQISNLRSSNLVHIWFLMGSYHIKQAVTLLTCIPEVYGSSRVGVPTILTECLFLLSRHNSDIETPCVFIYYIFRPIEAISRLIEPLQSPFYLLYLPTLGSVYTLGLRCRGMMFRLYGYNLTL